MAISLVRQSGKIQATGTAVFSANYSFGVLPAVGNVIVVTVFGWNTADPAYTASDNQGNTYTMQAGTGTGGGGERILSAPINTSAGTFTVTVTNNGSGSATITF